jgi:hypothetical protein
VRKERRFDRVKFSARIIRKAIDACRTLTDGWRERDPYLTTTMGDEGWTFDSLDEYFAQYSKSNVEYATLTIRWQNPDHSDMELRVSRSADRTVISVQAEKRDWIDSVFAIFEEASSEDKTIDAPPAEIAPKISVFIGHGRQREWEKL